MKAVVWVTGMEPSRGMDSSSSVVIESLSRFSRWRRELTGRVRKSTSLSVKACRRTASRNTKLYPLNRENPPIHPFSHPQCGPRTVVWTVLTFQIGGSSLKMALFQFSIILLQCTMEGLVRYIWMSSFGRTLKP